MTDETTVQNRVRLEAAEHNILLWRNNSGVFTNEVGVPVRFGLGNTSAKINKKIKSSDLIGITPVIITAEHVGRTMGVFTAFEIKNLGWVNVTNQREIAQQEFLKHVNRTGGIGAFVTDPSQVITIMQNYIK